MRKAPFIFLVFIALACNKTNPEPFPVPDPVNHTFNFPGAGNVVIGQYSEVDGEDFQLNYHADSNALKNFFYFVNQLQSDLGQVELLIEVYNDDAMKYEHLQLQFHQEWSNVAIAPGSKTDTVFFAEGFDEPFIYEGLNVQVLSVNNDTVVPMQGFYTGNYKHYHDTAEAPVRTGQLTAWVNYLGELTIRTKDDLDMNFISGSVDETGFFTGQAYNGKELVAGLVTTDSTILFTETSTGHFSTFLLFEEFVTTTDEENYLEINLEKN